MKILLIIILAVIPFVSSTGWCIETYADAEKNLKSVHLTPQHWSGTKQKCNRHFALYCHPLWGSVCTPIWKDLKELILYLSWQKLEKYRAYSGNN